MFRIFMQLSCLDLRCFLILVIFETRVAFRLKISFAVMALFPIFFVTAVSGSLHQSWTFSLADDVDESALTA